MSVLITFEKTREGLGGTTQALLLYQELFECGIKVMLTKEPGGTEAGKMIRELLLNRSDVHLDPTAELLLFNADRAHHVNTVIRPALNEGVIVISDRYYDSTLAYQHYGRGLNRHMIWDLHQISANALVPDLTFVLHGTPFVDLDESDRFERESEDFRKRVEDGMLEIAHNEPERCKLIYANRPIHEVAEEISGYVDELLVKKGLIPNV